MPGSVQTKLQSLYARAAKGNPEMLDILNELIREVDRLGIIIDPPPVIQTRASSETFGVPDSPAGISAIINPRNVILFWEAPTSDVIYYELRKGTVWATAERILITAERQVILDPLLEGDHTFLLKSLSLDGQYSTGTESLTLTIPEMGAPNVTTQTIDQNVLLFWTPPASTFEITEYVIERNGFEVARVSGTFAAYVELVGDTYEYSVRAVDIAGNEGSEGVVSVLVAGPPDFILRNDFQSDLSGTKVNAKIETYDISLLLPINLTETWDEHFSDRLWTEIQDQIDAGYPLYIQPGTTTASYSETFDVGTIYPSTILSISWNVSIITGSFTISVSTRVSDDGIAWSTPQIGQNIFVESVRYIEVTVNFTGNNDAALLKFFNFRVAVQVKQSMDSGIISAVSSDPTGTFVNFNVPFKDVDSLTLTVEETTGPFTALYDFNDIPNPTGFSVYVFNTAGVRQSKEVSWKARGII